MLMLQTLGPEIIARLVGASDQPPLEWLLFGPSDEQAVAAEEELPPLLLAAE